MIYSIIYNLFFHPLRHFPGPKAAAATPFPFVRRLLDGRMPQWTTKLHLKYGDVVRVHPDELSFTGASAFQDIYNTRPQLPKPDIGTLISENGVRPLPTIVNQKDHTRQRRVLSHAFSDHALRDQESIIQKYSDLFIERLFNQVKQGISTVDICLWYNFVTFDIIGDLSFGESFQCLENADNHPWIKTVYQGIKAAKLVGAFEHFPPMRSIIRWSLPKFVKEKIAKNFDFTKEKVTKRIAQDLERPDFIKYILDNNDKSGMTRGEIDSTVAVLILAGSGETTAVVLTAATLFALKTPGVMERLQKEVCDHVRDTPNAFSIESLNTLPYLHAVIQEAMRIHPPVPVSPPREVNQPGFQVCGHTVPQGYRAGIPARTAYRLPSRWAVPHEFHPERWLPEADARFANDDKAIFEPFMVGPRNCMGRKLAWAELNLILAKLIWSFDLELSADNTGDWTDQRVWLINEKLPMFVKLKPRV